MNKYKSFIAGRIRINIEKPPFSVRFDGLFWRLAQRDDLLIEAISRCLDVGFWVSYLYMIIHVYTVCVKINIIILTQRVSSKKKMYCLSLGPHACWDRKKNEV